MLLVKTSQQLQMMQCSEDDNIHKHFDKLANLWEQLAAIGKSVPDTEYASILMGLLPKMYTAMLGSIAAASELSGMAVFSTIVTKIVTDEYDWYTIGTEKAKDKAFTAETQKKWKGPKHDIECKNCHKKEHSKAQCWAKGGSNEGGGPRWKPKKENEKSNVAALSN